MEKGYVIYFVFEHSPPHGSTSSQSGLFLYKLDTDDIDAASLHPSGLDRGTSKPLGQPIFQFVPGKYPKGMGCGALDGKLYFFGGYFPSVSEDVPRQYSEKLYILDPSLIKVGEGQEFVEKNTIEIRDSKSKNILNPIVVTVKQKLYILPRNFGAEYETPPCIQSYEPYGDQWENYDIFKLLGKDSDFASQPQASFSYQVRAHCVRDNEIIIVLSIGTYSLNVDLKTLTLMAKHQIVFIVPFTGLAAVVDGRFFGVARTCVSCYQEPPLQYIGTPSVTVFSCPRDLAGARGLVIHLADAEKNKFLVVRSGTCRTYHRVYTCLAFDFLCLAEVDELPYSKRSTSIIYHVDENEEGYQGHIIACFPIRKKPVPDQSIIPIAAPAISHSSTEEYMEEQAPWHFYSEEG